MGFGRAIAFFIVLVAAAGCGGGTTSTVEGRVSLKGQPLVSGQVSFCFPDDTVYESGILPDGTYTIPNVKPGVAKVTVVSIKPPPADKKPSREPSAHIGPVADPNKWFPIPEKYGSKATTDKEVTVKGGSQTIDIDLE